MFFDFFFLLFSYTTKDEAKNLPRHESTAYHGVIGHYVSFFKIESRKVRTTLYRFGFCMFLNEIGINWKIP